MESRPPGSRSEPGIPCRGGLISSTQWQTSLDGRFAEHRVNCTGCFQLFELIVTIRALKLDKLTAWQGR